MNDSISAYSFMRKSLQLHFIIFVEYQSRGFLTEQCCNTVIYLLCAFYFLDTYYIF